MDAKGYISGEDDMQAVDRQAEDRLLLSKVCRLAREEGWDQRVHMLDLKVRDQHVTVNGNLDGAEVQKAIVETLRGFPGVAGVDDQLNLCYRPS